MGREEMQDELERSLKLFEADPADSDFQRGYMAALQWMQALLAANLGAPQ